MRVNLKWSGGKYKQETFGQSLALVRTPALSKSGDRRDQVIITWQTDAVATGR